MQDEVGKGGITTSWEMAADAGTLRRAQGRAEEDGGWRVAGAGDVQVGGSFHRKRRWEARKKREVFEDECIHMERR